MRQTQTLPFLLRFMSSRAEDVGRTPRSSKRSGRTCSASASARTPIEVTLPTARPVVATGAQHRPVLPGSRCARRPPDRPRRGVAPATDRSPERIFDAPTSRSSSSLSATTSSTISTGPGSPPSRPRAVSSAGRAFAQEERAGPQRTDELPVNRRQTLPWTMARRWRCIRTLTLDLPDPPSSCLADFGEYGHWLTRFLMMNMLVARVGRVGRRPSEVGDRFTRGNVLDDTVDASTVSRDVGTPGQALHGVRGSDAGQYWAEAQLARRRPSSTTTPRATASPPRRSRTLPNGRSVLQRVVHRLGAESSLPFRSDADRPARPSVLPAPQPRSSPRCRRPRRRAIQGHRPSDDRRDR